MKKLIAMLLALSLAVSMFGCGDGDGKGLSTKPSGTGATKPSTAPTQGTSTPEFVPVDFPSHTGTDEEARNARPWVIATVGDQELTNGEFGVCYWMGVYSFLNNYGYYASQLGLNLNYPLDKQGPKETEGSWQDFFIEDALSAWHIYMAVSLACKDMDVEMPATMQEELDGMWDLMEESAEKEGFDSVDAMIQKDAGAGTTGEDYFNYTQHYYWYMACIKYLNDTTEVTDADIEKYFTDHEKELSEKKITKDSGNVFGVRHILIAPEGGTTDKTTGKTTGKTTYTDAEWEACRAEAQKLMDEWAGGTATEETFSHYAMEYSTDPGSKSEGGLYEGLDKDTNFVEPFKNWYLEDGRKVGDYGLVKSDYGYHIMYLSSVEAKWIYHCRNAFIEDTVDTFVENAKKEFPMETDEDKIVLGDVKLVSES